MFEQVNTGDTLLFFINGDETGELHTEIINERNVEMYNVMIREGSIEVFDIRRQY